MVIVLYVKIIHIHTLNLFNYINSGINKISITFAYKTFLSDGKI